MTISFTNLEILRKFGSSVSNLNQSYITSDVCSHTLELCNISSETNCLSYCASDY